MPFEPRGAERVRNSRVVRHGRRPTNAEPGDADLSYQVANPGAAVAVGQSRFGLTDRRVDQSRIVANGVDSATRSDPLVVVYWNVAGIAASNIDTFFFDMENEVLWDVLIL